MTLPGILALAAFMSFTFEAAGRVDPGSPGPVAGPPGHVLTIYILSTSPADGEDNVSVDRPIVIVLSEPPSPTSLSIEINPAITLSIVWGNGSNMTTLILYHAPFQVCTRYTVDVQSPDLGIGPVPTAWSFDTECPYRPAQNLTIRRLSVEITAADVPPGFTGRWDVPRAADSVAGPTPPPGTGTTTGD